MKGIRQIAAAVALFSAFLPAQNQGVLVPLNNRSIDYITQVATSVNNLVMADCASRKYRTG